MNKRYQVFISSTSRDLQNARQEVSQALLRSDCFPAQMEQWPATDEEQFEFIKQIISECDYYIVITAGMYGSIHPKTGISYTEMEFDYAQELGIPTIRLLHKSPFETLTGLFVEGTDKARKKLTAFRNKLLDGRMCAFWETPTELGREVILSLNDIKKRKPMEGWVKASEMATSEALIEIANLQREVSDLRFRHSETVIPVNISMLLEGLSDSIPLTQYRLAEQGYEEEWGGFDTSFLHRLRTYLKTENSTQIGANKFARGLLYGLLFHSDISSSIRHAFMPSDTDPLGYPKFLLECDQLSSIEDLLMTLESAGIIVAYEKFDSTPSLTDPSYAGSYRWKLTETGHEWIVKNGSN